MNIEAWGFRALMAAGGLIIAPLGFETLMDLIDLVFLPKKKWKVRELPPTRLPKWPAKLLMLNFRPWKTPEKRFWLYRIALLSWMVYSVHELLLGWLPLVWPVRIYCALCWILIGICDAWGEVRRLKKQYGTAWVLFSRKNPKRAVDSILFAPVFAMLPLGIAYGYLFGKFAA